MSLSHYPDWVLMTMSDNEELSDDLHDEWSIGYAYESDNELDRRVPNIEPEYDSLGQPITSSMIGYDEQGEIWITKNI